jgi:putative heme iron utilization protein
MPRYHFDSHDGVRFTTDETGVELDGINAARQEAARRLAELAQEILPDDDRREVVIEVKDETGQRVLVAKLSVSIEATELPGFSPVE